MRSIRKNRPQFSYTLNNVTVTGNTAGFGGGIHWDAWSYEEESKMANLQPIM